MQGFAPILTFNNKHFLLSNYCLLTDDSTTTESKVTATTRGGSETEFTGDDADFLLEKIETLLTETDAVDLPIVGVGNRILILFNFALVEDFGDDDESRVVLTSDDNTEFEFFGSDADLILARLDSLTGAMNVLWKRLTTRNLN